MKKTSALSGPVLLILAGVALAGAVDTPYYLKTMAAPLTTSVPAGTAYALLGATGAPGPQGPAGAEDAPKTLGPAAPPGLRGPQGIPGPTGPTGQQGPEGGTGSTGKTGPQKTPGEPKY